MGLLIFLAGLAALIVAGVRYSYRQLQAKSDPYPLSVLSQPLRGEEAIVTTDDGTRLYTVMMGSGDTTVLLAHGVSVTMREWNVIADKLVALGYRVIAFDQRGHGKTTIGSQGISSAAMAADYKALLEHFSLKNAILLAHSMGTFLSILFMITYPESARQHLKAAVLMSPFAGDVYKGAPQSRLQIGLIRSGVMQRIVGSEVLGAVLFGTTLYGDQPSPAGVKVFLEEFRSNDQRKLIPIFEAFGAESYYDRLHTIPIPVTLICGRKDRTTPPWHTEKLAANIPDARVVWVEGAGHLLNWEAPDVVVEAVKTQAG
jgi:pimeloyl-ACP methyl ester carboxylesterase